MKKSRVVIGFHRLGIVLAIPLLIGAFGTAISAWFTKDGAYVEDLKAVPEFNIVLVRSPGALNSLLGSSSSDSKTIRVEVDTGPRRTFAIRPANEVSDQPKFINSVIDSVTQFERRRGAVLSTDEQPVEVGGFALVQEDLSKRDYSWAHWTHLKTGFDWQRVMIAGGIAAFAFLIYGLARAFGWVIDGFVSPTKAGTFNSATSDTTKAESKTLG